MSSPVLVETLQAGKVEKPKRSWADEGNSSDDESTTPENHNEDKTSDPYAPEPKEQHQQQHQYQQQQQQQQQRPERGEAQTGRNSYSDIPMDGPFFAYVGNLPYKTSSREVGEFFVQGGCDVLDVIIKLDDQGHSRGYAHVEFKSRDSLLKSFDGNGYEIGQRSIKVDYHPVKQKNDRGGRMGGGGDRDRDRNDNIREETEVSWVRAPRREPAPLPPKPDSNRPIVRGNAPDRGDRGSDRGATRGVSNRDRPAREQEQQPPAVRAKIVLDPRKINVEGEEQPAARVSDIFGGGKPHDENKYEEERKKKIEKERIEAEEVAAKEKEMKAIADAAAAVSASAPVTASADSENPQDTAPVSGEALKTDVDAAADISAVGVKLEKVALDSTSQAIERGVVVPAAATSSDRPLSKQSSRRPSTDSDKGKGGRSNSGREGRGRGDGKYEGRGGFEGRGEGRHEGRGEGRGDGRGRSEGRGRGRGEGRDSSGRGGRGKDNRDSTARAPAAVVAPAAPAVPAVARVQVPLNMNMIGKGSNTGRKPADASKDSAPAVSAPAVKATPVPIVAQRNSFSDLGGDDSD